MTTEEIAVQVMKEWQMSFAGVELDFALELATRAVEAEREACAISAWMTGMDEHNKARGMPCDAREVGSSAARAIRKRSNAEITRGVTTDQNKCGA